MLRPPGGSTYSVLQSIYVVNGKFECIILPDTIEDITLPVRLTLQGNAGVENFMFFMTSVGETRIKGAGIDLNLWRATNDTPEQKECLELYPINEEYVACYSRYMTVVQRIMKSYENHEPVDSVLNKQATKLSEQTSSMSREMEFERYKKLASQESLSDYGFKIYCEVVCSGLKYAKYLEPYWVEIKAKYETFSEERKNSLEGRELYQAIHPVKQVALGDTIPSGELTDTAGVKHPMKELRGKYLLLDFWNGGCAPCIMAMPELKAIGERYADPLQVVGINIDKNKAWKKATKKQDISWINLSDGGGNNFGYANLFGVKGIPHYVLVDPNGVVIDVWGGYEKGEIQKRLESHGGFFKNRGRTFGSDD